MSKDDEQGGGKGAHEEVDRRQASLLLSGLVLTPDSALDVFRQRRAADSTLDLEHLRRARDILDQLSLAITSSEAERWQRVQRAWRALFEEEDSEEAADRAAPAAEGDDAGDAAAEPQADHPSAGGDDGSPARPPLIGDMAAAPPAKAGEHDSVQEGSGAGQREASAPPIDAAVSPAPPPAVSAAVSSHPPSAPAMDSPRVPRPVAERGGPPAPPALVRRPEDEPSDGVSPWASLPSRPVDGSGDLAPEAPSPTASAPPAPPAPPVPPASAAPPPPVDAAPDEQPPPEPAPKVAGIDVAALNRVKLSETEPSTISVDNLDMSRSVLPFRKGEANAPPPAAGEIDDDADLGETAEIGAVSPLATTTLPFKHPTNPGESGQEATEDAAPRESGPGVVVAEDSAPGPDAVVESPKPTGAQRVRTVPPVRSSLSPAAASDVAAGMLGTAAATAEETGVTTALPEPSKGSGPGGKFPDPPAHLRSMSVERYAALCAECTVHPDWMSQILTRYEIQSRAERTALDTHWRARMAADVELTRQFRWHYAHYEQWAKQQQQ